MGTRYIPHILYSTAIVSLSMNLIALRNDHTEQRNRLLAQVSVLTSLQSALASQHPDMTEVERLRKLAGVRKAEFQAIQPIKWKDVLFGGSRKLPPMTEAQEREEISKIMAELGIKFEADSDSS
ncbi:hypothetical protein DL96DRAFT_1706773 [Flagelloscypha sp. PMI_526]|nr:hypothetical protein DL96DRAFT_1706773 [Flagelloscypha sp. PMI_526]